MNSFVRTCSILGRLAACLSVATYFGGSPLPAAERPIVPGFERFQGDAGASAELGRLLLSELNCLSCHTADEKTTAAIGKKQAPILNSVGARLRPEFIREYLENPAQARPGSTMPQVLGELPAAERRRAAEALTHFLALTGAASESPAIRSQVARGDQLFHSVGCVACHDPQRGDVPAIAGSVPLEHVSRKYALPGLAQFLVDPLAVRPAGRMPHLNLKPEEGRDIASFLLKNLQLHSNLRYAYYEGSWDKLPDFATLKPKSSGQTAGFDVNLGRSDNFAVRFEGTMTVAKEGEYQFHIESDDGSRLAVDGKTIVVNDGVHPAKNETGRARLTAGKHVVVVEYFEGGGEQSLKVEYEGAGLPRQSLELALDALDAGKNKQPGASERFTVDPELAAQGKQLYAKLQCASCHVLKGAEPTPPLAAIPALAKLPGPGGCVAEQPTGKSPHYPVNEAQRKAIRAALEGLRQPSDAAAKSAGAIPATLLAFNCYACHQRGERGGVVEARNAFFASNQPEMGDEGRVPPHLNGIGGKLTREWLKQVLENGTKDRPYMFTRMPKFGGANVGHLVSAFEQADPEPKLTNVDAGVSATQLKATGRKLVGAQGYSCIKCHTWGNVPATGIQSITMTTMTKRLRESWFREYVLDPPKYRPGTRMPAAWPMGQSLLPNVLGGDTSKQIHSVWSFLTDGDKAAMPQGLGRDPIELIADVEPVMYRNFIEGAGPRAIGVGYPEKANLAFDANDLRIALLWQGSFIDAARHWIDRGTGFQPPLGDNVLKLPAGPSFARLEAESSPWPTKSPRELDYRFRGYRLNDKRQPIFLYSFAGVDVEDLPTPLVQGEHVGVRRELVVSAKSPVAGGYYRAALGDKIEAADGGWFVVDGGLRVRVTGGTPSVRESAGKKELLVPFAAGPQPLKLVHEYQW